MGDPNVLGCAPALKSLWSQILCKLYKRSSNETLIINQGQLSPGRCMQKDQILYMLKIQ